MSKIVEDFQIINHGIEWSDYFRGCGVIGTTFDEVFTGTGDNPKEALENALEQAASSGWVVEWIENNFPETPSVTGKFIVGNPDKEYDEYPWYYMSIRLKEDHNPE